MDKPTEVIILGKHYSIDYVDKPSDVDIYKRDSLFGQVDYWTQTIRIYDNGRPMDDIMQTVIHEVLHAIAQNLHLAQLSKSENHDELDLIALALTDFLFRNKWIE